eukprot:9235925-Pyramimonas_sp.AAC.1
MAAQCDAARSPWGVLSVGSPKWLSYVSALGLDTLGAGACTTSLARQLADHHPCKLYDKGPHGHEAQQQDVSASKHG